MQLTGPLKVVLIAFLLVLPAGCTGSMQQAQPAGATGSVEMHTPPADSPLAACIDPSPSRPRSLDAAIAQNFSEDRVRTAFSLDDGTFRAVPASRDALPRISASQAFCNLLAGTTATNFHVTDAAAEHGMSFGLGVVTVADAVLDSGPRSYLVGGGQQTSRLQPYHGRLAWIAVIKVNVASSCPSMPVTATPHPTTSQEEYPGYQILALDADTGGAGIIYSARTNALCGGAGYQPASVAPAVEFVSVPWTMVTRGPGTQSATISYQLRPCDQPVTATFNGTEQPVVLADRRRPGLVGVVLERVLTACGPPKPMHLLLRSSTLTTDLPQRLIHAPVGAQDVPG